MIDFMKGMVRQKDEQSFVLESGNMGFRLLSTSQSLETLEVGQECMVFTELVVREDAMILLGFSDRSERDVYRLLVTVSGVGAKVALSVLSSIPYVTLCAAILENDTKTIQSAQGVGKKTAERIALELGDKKKVVEVLGSSYSSAVTPKKKRDEVFDEAYDEVLSALLALGYRRQEAEKLLNGIEREGLSTEDVLAEALRKTFS